jgi:hypothetical protein
MRIFVCGHELGLGFVIARRLVAEGHRVNILTGFEDLVPNLTKNGLNPVLGEITDDDPQRLLAKADAVMDAAFPSTFLKKRVHGAASPNSPERCTEVLREAAHADEPCWDFGRHWSHTSHRRRSSSSIARL